MSYEDENLLQNVLKEILKTNTILLWTPDESTCKQVVSISKRADEEGLLCGNFENGQYIALYGCELSDFIVGTRLQPS